MKLYLNELAPWEEKNKYHHQIRIPSQGVNE